MAENSLPHPQSFPPALRIVSHGGVVDQVAGLQRRAAQHLRAGEAHSLVDQSMAEVQASYHAAINAAETCGSCLKTRKREAESLGFGSANTGAKAHLRRNSCPPRLSPLSAIVGTPASTT